MSPQWIPQNIQKRLLLYVLQQLSLFSEIDMPNLEEVSLNNIIMRDVMIDPEKVGKIPGFNLRYGRIGCLELNGGVMGGVNVEASDLDVVVALDVGYHNNMSKSVQFSLAQSTADLVNTMIIDKDNEIQESGKTADQEEYAETKSNDSNSESSESSRNFVFSGVMTKAVEMALSKLHVKMKNINIKVLSEYTDLKLQIEEISLVTVNGRKQISINGVKVFSLNDDINKGKESQSADEENTETSETDEDSGDSYEDANLPADESLMNSMVFTHEEASSIYMSATSASFNKPAENDAFKSDDNKRSHAILTHIDTINLSFEGLNSIQNLKIDIDNIKVSLVPVIPSVILILDGIDRGIKIKNHELRKHNAHRKTDVSSKFPQYTDDDNIEDSDLQLDEENSNDGLLSRLHIEKVTLSASSALNMDGKFASPNDDLLISLGNVNIKRKNEKLTYGGVEYITINSVKEGNTKTTFAFKTKDNHQSKPLNEGVNENEEISQNEEIKSNASNTSSTPDKADFRFEICESDDENLSKEITALFSKPAILELDACSLSELIHIGKCFSTIFESYSQIKGTFENNQNNFIKKEETSKSRTSFVLQTASFDICISVSESPFLKLVVFPISYSSEKNKMLISKMILSSLDMPIEKTLGHISNVQFLTTAREINAFVNRNSLTPKLNSNEAPREVVIKTSLSIIVPIISLSLEKADIKYLSNKFSIFHSEYMNFWHDVDITESCVNKIKKKETTESKKDTYLHSTMQNRRRITRLGNSLNNYGLSNMAKSNPASFSITLKTIDIKISDILPEFGELRIELSDLMMYQLNKVLYGSIMKLNIERSFEIQEKLVSGFQDRNEEESHYPLIVGVLKTGERGKILDVTLREFLIEYYTNWLNFIGSNKVNKEKEIFKHKEIEGHPTQTAASNDNKFDIRLTFQDCIVGLNPGRLQSKLMFTIEKGTSDITFELNKFYVKSSLREISILLIDDYKYVKQAIKDKPKTNIHSTYISPLSFLVSSGYAVIGTINCTHIGVTINTNIDELMVRNARLGIKDSLSLMDIKINSDEHQIDLCPDSAHTLTQLINDLKLPITLKDEEKFKVNVDGELDLLQDIIDNEFSQNIGHTDERDYSDDYTSIKKENNEFHIVDGYYDQIAPLTQSTQNLQISDSRSSNTNSDNCEFSIDLQENHFNDQGIDISNVKTQPIELNINLSRVKIYLYDGYEWKDTRKAIKSAVKRIETEGKKEFIKKVESTNTETPGKVKFDNNIKSAEGESSNSSKTASLKSSQGILKEDSTDEDYSETSLIGETLYKSIHVTLPKGSDPVNLANNINKVVQNESIKSKDLSVPNVKNLKLRKSKSHKVLIDVRNIEVNVSVLSTRDPRKIAFLSDQEYEIVNNVELRVDTLNIYDNVPTSTWNKLLSYMNVLGDREIGTSMLKLTVTNVRPDPNLISSEAMIHVSLLPIRLYVDQDTSDFLARFFSFKDVRFDLPPDEVTYIQKLKIDAIRLKLDYKPKKIDYVGIKSGNTSELMNLFILDGSDLTLSTVKVHGILGVSKLGDILKKAWLPEIHKTQLAGILSGLSPIRSLVNIGGGVKDLVAIPVKEYKRDGRFLRSLQKGTFSFTKTTGYEILNLGAKIASGTQVLLEQGEELLGGEGSAARMPGGHSKAENEIIDDQSFRNEQKKAQLNRHAKSSKASGIRARNNLLESSQLLTKNFQDEKDQYGGDKLYSFAEMDETNDIDPTLLHRSLLLLDSQDSSRGDDLVYHNGMGDSSDSDFDPDDGSEKLVSLYSNQPESVNEGLKDAYKSFGRNLKSTQRVIRSLKSEISEKDNYQDSLLSILKSTPVILIRPVIGTTEALSKTLLGISNEIDPSRVAESKDKYKFEKK